MVRGTYLPWPSRLLETPVRRIICALRTSLGEEGIKTVVVVFLLALLSEVAIGLVGR